MGTINDKLNKVLTSKEAIRTAINSKGGKLETTTPLAAYSDAINNLSSGDEWKPDKEWWDIEAILNTDTRNYPAKAIYLITDNFPTASLVGGAAYATSDGAFYTTSTVTHTWDASKDKECSRGYKTRYVIAYLSSATCSYTPGYMLSNTLYAVFSKINFTAFSIQYRYTVESVRFINCTGTLTSLSYACNNCCSLISVVFPDTWISVSNLTYTFNSCYNLKSVVLPDTWISVSNLTSTFGGCYNLKSVILPDTWVNISTLAFTFSSCAGLKYLQANKLSNATGSNDAFGYMSSLLKISLNGIKSSFRISESQLLGYNQLLHLIQNLGTPTTTQTCTIGSNNLTILKSTQEGLNAIAAAQAKNWTIN